MVIIGRTLEEVRLSIPDFFDGLILARLSGHFSKKSGRNPGAEKFQKPGENPGFSKFFKFFSDKTYIFQFIKFI